MAENTSEYDNQLALSKIKSRLSDIRVACLKPKLILVILSYYVVLRLLILELLIIDLLG